MRVGNFWLNGHLLTIFKVGEVSIICLFSYVAIFYCTLKKLVILPLIEGVTLLASAQKIIIVYLFVD